jgi:outer membrane protein
MSSLRLSLPWLFFIVVALPVEKAVGQCAGVASTPQEASDCAAHGIPGEKVAALDPTHSYSLAELIDIAEHNNPRTRILWERAKQMRSNSV